MRGVDPELIRMARSYIDRPRVGDDVVSPSLLAVAVHNPGVFSQNLLLEGTDIGRAWLMARAQLRWLFDNVRTQGAEVALVIIPASLQVTRDQAAFLKRAGFWIRPEHHKTRKLQQLLVQFARKERIMVLDLLPALRAQPEPAKLFFKHDTHFNERGNQVVFEIVKKRLLEPWLKRHRAATGVVRSPH